MFSAMDHGKGPQPLNSSGAPEMTLPHQVQFADQRGMDVQVLIGDDDIRGDKLHDDTFMTFEQRMRLVDWKEFAQHGLEMHRLATSHFKSVYFWWSVLPCMTMSALISMLTVTIRDADRLQLFKDVSITVLGGLIGLLTGISAYWEWQGEGERHRFASHEYDGLMHRIELAMLQIEMGEKKFVDVMHDIDKSIAEIKKQCGPPPAHIEARVTKASLLQEFTMAKELYALKSGVGAWEQMFRTFCCCCFCCSRRQNDSSAEETLAHHRILDEKIYKIGRNRITTDLNSFWEAFWTTFKTFAEKKDVASCKTLLSDTPVARTHKKVTYDQNGRNPLHHAVTFRLGELGMWLLGEDNMDKTNTSVDMWERPAVDMCLWADNQMKAPAQYLDANHFFDSMREFSITLIIETFRASCSSAVKSTFLPVDILKSVQSLLSPRLPAGDFIDSGKNTLLHIAASSNQVEACQILLKAPFFIAIDLPNSHNKTSCELAIRHQASLVFAFFFKHIATHAYCTVTNKIIASETNGGKLYNWGLEGAEILKNCFAEMGTDLGTDRKSKLFNYYYTRAGEKETPVCAISHYFALLLNDHRNEIYEFGFLHYSTLFANRELVNALLDESCPFDAVHSETKMPSPIYIAMQRAAKAGGFSGASPEVDDTFETCNDIAKLLINRTCDSWGMFTCMAQELLSSKHKQSHVFKADNNARFPSLFRFSVLEWVLQRRWTEECEKILLLRYQQGGTQALGIAREEKAAVAIAASSLQLVPLDGSRQSIGIPPATTTLDLSSPIGIIFETSNTAGLKSIIKYAALAGRDTLGAVLNELTDHLNEAQHGLAQQQCKANDLLFECVNMWFEFKTKDDIPTWLFPLMKKEWPFDIGGDKYIQFPGQNIYVPFGATSVLHNSGKIYYEIKLHDWEDCYYFGFGWEIEKEYKSLMPNELCMVHAYEICGGMLETKTGDEEDFYQSELVVGVAIDFDSGKMLCKAICKKSEETSKEGDSKKADLSSKFPTKEVEFGKLSNLPGKDVIGKFFPTFRMCSYKTWCYESCGSVSINLKGPFSELPAGGYQPAASSSEKPVMEIVGDSNDLAQLQKGHFSCINFFHLAILVGLPKLIKRLIDQGVKYLPLRNDLENENSLDWTRVSRFGESINVTPLDLFKESNSKKDPVLADLILLGITEMVAQEKFEKSLEGMWMILHQSIFFCSLLKQSPDFFFKLLRLKTSMPFLFAAQFSQPDVTIVESDGRNLLHIAALNGLYDACLELLRISERQKGIYYFLKSSDQSGNTPFSLIGCGVNVEVEEEVFVNIQHALALPFQKASLSFCQRTKRGISREDWSDYGAGEYFKILQDGVLEKSEQFMFLLGIYEEPDIEWDGTNATPYEDLIKNAMLKVMKEKLASGVDFPLHVAMKLGMLSSLMYFTSFAEGALADMVMENGCLAQHWCDRIPQTPLVRWKVDSIIADKKFDLLFEWEFMSRIESIYEDWEEVQDFAKMLDTFYACLGKDGFRELMFKKIGREGSEQKLKPLTWAFQSHFSGLAKILLKLFLDTGPTKRHTELLISQLRQESVAEVHLDFISSFLGGLSCVIVPLKPSAVEGTWKMKNGTAEMSMALTDKTDRNVPILVSAFLNNDLEVIPPSLSIKQTSSGVHCESVEGELAVMIAPQLAVTEGSWYFEVHATKLPLFVGWADSSFEPDRSNFFHKGDHHWGIVLGEKEFRVVGDFYNKASRQAIVYRHFTHSRIVGCQFGPYSQIIFTFDDWTHTELTFGPRSNLQGTALYPLIGGHCCNFDFRYMKADLKYVPRGVKPIGDVTPSFLNIKVQSGLSVKTRPHRASSWWACVQGLQPVVVKPNVMTWIGDQDYVTWERITPATVTPVRAFEDGEGDAEDDISPEDLKATPVHVLRKLCQDRSLNASGNKEDLVERLSASYSKKSQEQSDGTIVEDADDKDTKKGKDKVEEGWV